MPGGNAPSPFDRPVSNPLTPINWSGACLSSLGLQFSPQSPPPYPYVLGGMATICTIPALVPALTSKVGYTVAQAWGSVNASLAEPGISREMIGSSNNPWYQAICAAEGKNSYVAWPPSPAYSINRDGTLFGTLGLLGGSGWTPIGLPGPGTVPTAAQAQAAANALTQQQLDAFNLRRLPGNLEILILKPAVSQAANNLALADPVLGPRLWTSAKIQAADATGGNTDGQMMTGGILAVDRDFAGMGCAEVWEQVFTQENIPMLGTDFLSRWGFNTAVFTAINNQLTADAINAGVPLTLLDWIGYGIDASTKINLIANQYATIWPLPTLGACAMLAAQTVPPMIAGSDPTITTGMMSESPEIVNQVIINPAWQTLSWIYYQAKLLTFYLCGGAQLAQSNTAYDINMVAEQDPLQTNGTGITYDPIFSVVNQLGITPVQALDPTLATLSTQQKQWLWTYGVLGGEPGFAMQLQNPDILQATSNIWPAFAALAAANTSVVPGGANPPLPLKPA